MADKSVSATTNSWFTTMLFLVFLVLKLTHTIAWSWWWVTAPLWIPAGFVLLILGFILLVALLAAFMN